jgi:hypothetical protein
VPGLKFDKNYATVVLGARTELFGLQSNFGLSASAGQKRAQDATLFANFSGTSKQQPGSALSPGRAARRCGTIAQHRPSA